MVDFFFLLGFALNRTFSCGLRDKLDIRGPFLQSPEDFSSPKGHS